MKRLISIIAIVFMMALMNPILSHAQYRPDANRPTITERVGIPYIPENSSAVLGFFDPSRFEMQHSYSISYSSGGPYSGSLGLYTNRMSYMITDNLQLIADIGFMHQPFQSAGNMPNFMNNGELFYGGELRYRPNDNTMFRIRFDNMPRFYSPYSYYGGGYDSYGMGRGYMSPFGYGY